MKAVVIGYGCPGRGDDAVGLLVARRLRDRLPADVKVIEFSRDGVSLLDAWAGAKVAIIVDAMVTGAAPGSILRLDGRRLPPADELALSSTHAFGLREALGLGAILGGLPEHIAVVGIESREFALGRPVSAEVAESIAEAVFEVEDALAEAADGSFALVHSPHEG